MLTSIAVWHCYHRKEWIRNFLKWNCRKNSHATGIFVAPSGLWGEWAEVELPRTLIPNFLPGHPLPEYEPPAHLSFSHSPPLCNNNASHHYILTWQAEILRNHISGWLLWQGGNLKVACRLPVPLVNIPLPLQQPRFGLPCSRSHTLRPRSWPSLLLCRLGYQFGH